MFIFRSPQQGAKKLSRTFGRKKGKSKQHATATGSGEQGPVRTGEDQLEQLSMQARELSDLSTKTFGRGRRKRAGTITSEADRQALFQSPGKTQGATAAEEKSSAALEPTTEMGQTAVRPAPTVEVESGASTEGAALPWRVTGGVSPDAEDPAGWVHVDKVAGTESGDLSGFHGLGLEDPGVTFVSGSSVPTFLDTSTSASSNPRAWPRWLLTSVGGTGLAVTVVGAATFGTLWGVGLATLPVWASVAISAVIVVGLAFAAMTTLLGLAALTGYYYHHSRKSKTSSAFESLLDADQQQVARQSQHVRDPLAEQPEDPNVAVHASLYQGYSLPQRQPAVVTIVVTGDDGKEIEVVAPKGGSSLQIHDPTQIYGRPTPFQ